MDEGPFRTSRPADRRAETRQAPTYRQPDEPQAAQPKPTSVERPPVTHASKQKNASKRSKLPFAIIIAVVIIGIIGWLALLGLNGKSGGTSIDKAKYQAVFFTNGQVYFGKLSTLSDENMKLTDVYYLQTKSDTATDANPQQTSSESDVQLIKLGSEIHGPEDEMILSKDQVLFYENLKTEGKVAQSIESYKKSH